MCSYSNLRHHSLRGGRGKARQTTRRRGRITPRVRCLAVEIAYARKRVLASGREKHGTLKEASPESRTRLDQCLWEINLDLWDRSLEPWQDGGSTHDEHTFGCAFLPTGNRVVILLDQRGGRLRQNVLSKGGRVRTPNHAPVTRGGISQAPGRVHEELGGIILLAVLPFCSMRDGGSWPS